MSLAINLGEQQPQTTQDPLQQVPPPFILPDTTPRSDLHPQTQAQAQAPHIAAVGLPLIVSSSAESNEAPQVVNAPDHDHDHDHEQAPVPTTNESPSPRSNGSNSGAGSASSAGSAGVQNQDQAASNKTTSSADSNTGTTSGGGGGKLGGLLSNWAPGASAALKRPLAMQRSLSGLFGMRSPGVAVAESGRSEEHESQSQSQVGGAAAATGRKMSRGSMTSDESSLLLLDEAGKSGVVYHRGQRNGREVDEAGGTGGSSAWNAGERRRRLPNGASGIVLHKDLWKVSSREALFAIKLAADLMPLMVGSA